MIEQFIKKDKRSNVFKHLFYEDIFSNLYQPDTFEITVRAKDKFQLNIEMILK